MLFDLLSLFPRSISVANIDSYKLFGLIEETFFPSSKGRNERMSEEMSMRPEPKRSCVIKTT